MKICRKDNLDQIEKRHYKVSTSDANSHYTRDDLRLAKTYFTRLSKAFPNTLFYQSSVSVDCPEGFARISLEKFLKPFKTLDRKELKEMVVSRSKLELNKITIDFEKELAKDLQNVLKLLQDILNKGLGLQDKKLRGKSFCEEFLALEEYEVENSLIFYSY